MYYSVFKICIAKVEEWKYNLISYHILATKTTAYNMWGCFQFVWHDNAAFKLWQLFGDQNKHISDPKHQNNT